MGVEEVREALAAEEFKANSAVVMIDLVVRRGIVTVDNEEGIAEACRRMHRRLPFAGFGDDA
jgi:hypothetical protein